MTQDGETMRLAPSSSFDGAEVFRVPGPATSLDRPVGLSIPSLDGPLLRDVLLDAYPLADEPFHKDEAAPDLETAERWRLNQREVIRRTREQRDAAREALTNALAVSGARDAEVEQVAERNAVLIRERDEALEAAGRSEARLAEVRAACTDAEDRARTWQDEALALRDKSARQESMETNLRQQLRAAREANENLRNRPQVEKARMEEAVAQQEAMARQLATVRAERDQARGELRETQARLASTEAQADRFATRLGEQARLDDAHARLDAERTAFQQNVQAIVRNDQPNLLTGALLIHPEKATPEALSAVIAELTGILAKRVNGS